MDEQESIKSFMDLVILNNAARVIQRFYRFYRVWVVVNE